MRKLLTKLACWYLDQDEGLTKMHSELHWLRRDKAYLLGLLRDLTIREVTEESVARFLRALKEARALLR